MTEAGWVLLSAEKLPPAVWAAVVADVRVDLPAVQAIHTGEQLMLGGVDAAELAVSVELTLLGRGLNRTLRVRPLPGPPPLPLPGLHCATAGVASLAAAAVLAALAPGSAPHVRSYTNVAERVVGAMPLIFTLHQILAQLANVAAVAGVPTDPAALIALAECHQPAGEWQLLLPGMAEALAAGDPEAAFAEGEMVFVPLVLGTQIALAAALVAGIADRRDTPAQLVASELLLGA